MSAISTKVFGNDMAMDVKGDFTDLYGLGKSMKEIHDYILSYQPPDDDEEACAFWSALACIEWEYGVLDSKIKAKATEIIRNHSDAALFFSERDREKRQKELMLLLEKLESVNHKPRKRKSVFVYRCPWEQGDVLAFPVYGKYAYFHVVGIRRHPHKIEELQVDQLYVKVFDRLSDKLLDINSFRNGLIRRQKYLMLSTWEGDNKELQQIWCTGKREKEAFEEKITLVGNVPVKEEYSRSIGTYFQFRRLEDTLDRRFKGLYLSPKYREEK